MGKFPNKRDFYYIVGFLIILLVFVATGRLADNTDVVDYVGFAGTIVSILLAVIAIIYSFYQSSTYESAISKLDNSANKIQEVTTKLSNVSEIESMMKEFKEEVIFFKESIEEVKNSVGRVDVEISSMKQSFESGFQSISNTGENTKIVYQKDYLEKFVGNSSKISLFLLLLIRNHSKANKPFELKEWTKKYYKFIEGKDFPTEAVLNRYMSAGIGVMAIYNQMEFFILKSEVKHTFLAKDFNQILDEVIQNKEDEISQDNKNIFYELLEKIRNATL
ncbi:hypothetical protein [Bacillus toyonensis]|uniref:hypothetical protein n=1 Tax=Bacillus toyonensis TaxID=155322 RepID=UPI000BFDE0F4|nr:hypothetical protein [Bacillus toyonensis]PHA78091.1 hypothetical protein COE72_00840 [Bacillus toyonensis]